MQQQMNQQEPIGGQQAMSQQMVLCPVRFVYETQVLVQPGDQIQPNQTFFINPQNPPPWMQNRPAPNPVVYVQQLPNNMVPSVQQHMDQNQLYLQQNFANFQLQQHMLAQSSQEIRPTMQLTNIVPNMVQNVQQTMTNDRNLTQNPTNTGQMQANAQNMIQNQINIANARQVANQPINQPINQTVEVQRQVFMNMRPQMGQQVNITRPVMSLNQFQNMQTLANMQNVQIQQANVGQTFMQNIGQPRPLAQSQNVTTIRPQAVANNVMNVQPVAKVREATPSEVNKTVTNTIGPNVTNVRNLAQNYNCRPIQPRRRYVQNNAIVPKIQSQHIPVQTIPTVYSPQVVDKSSSHQIVTNIAANTTYLNNPNINRKRKSESPDEIKNKMAVINNQTAKPNYINTPQQSIIVTKLCNEIGTNTSPVHKPNLNVNNAAFQMHSSTQMITVENTQPLNENFIKNTNEPKATITPLPSENDKLIRNTVYTQARGRLLQDKASDNLTPQVIENTTPPIVQNKSESIVSTEMQTEKAGMSTEKQTEATQMITEVQTKTVEITKIENIVTPANEPEKCDTKPIETEVKNEIKVKEESQVTEPISEENKERLEGDDKKVLKQDILTHVVDGYVIQESNFAFPIRKPLKEKTLFTNPRAEDSDSTDALKECMKEEMKSTAVDIPLLPFHYLLLNCEKKEEEGEKNDEEDSGKSNPFAKLQHNTVKSWTIEDLSSHLQKYDWKETVSVLQDHEIDGESLFLVSKTQLMTIGVQEEHADLICEFVRS